MTISNPSILKSHRLILLLTASVASGILLHLYFSQQLRIGFLFNSDALYIPDLSRNILNEGFSQLNDWNFSRAPSFIDAFVYMFLNYFFEAYKSIAFYFVVQIVVTLLLFYKLFNVFYTKLNSALFSSIGLMLFVGLIAQEIFPYFIALKIAHHYSEFIISVIFSLYLIQHYKFKINVFSSALCLLCITQAISDQLFYLHFLVPAFIYLCGMAFVQRDNKNDYLYLALFVALSSIFALVVSKYLLDPNLVKNTVKFSIANLKTDIARFYQLVININAKSFVILIANVIFYSYGLFILLSKKLKTRFFVFIFLSLLTTIIILLVSPNANVIGRYLLPFIYLPILMICVTLPNLNDFRFHAFLGFVLLFITYLIIKKIEPKPWLSEFYPQSVACVDEKMSQAKIGNAMAGYWIARRYTFLSKSNLNVVPYHKNYEQDTRVANYNNEIETISAIFVDSQDGKGFRSKEVISDFGAPDKIIDCQNLSIFVYESKNLIANNQ